MILRRLKQRHVCVHCHSVNRTVEDERNNNIVCTNCGVVQPFKGCLGDKLSYSDISRYSRLQQAQCLHSSSSSSSAGRGGRPGKNSGGNKQSHHVARNTSLLDRYNPEDAKMTKLLCLVTNVVEEEGVGPFSEAILSSAKSIISNNTWLTTIRSQQKVAVCVSVFAARQLGRDVELLDVEQRLGVKNLSRTIRKLGCKLRLSTRSLCAERIPEVSFKLALSYKMERQLQIMFKKLTSMNSAVGSNTLLAFCVWKLLKNKMPIPLEKIAEVTGASTCSLKLYIQGKKKIRH